MVNSELLQKHAQQLKVGKPAATDYYKEWAKRGGDLEGQLLLGNN